MPTIFIGALALVLWPAKSFARADPKCMIRVASGPRFSVHLDNVESTM
jgi:hypothetical protein